jgi:cytochrome P450
MQMTTVESRRGCPIVEGFDYSAESTATAHMAMFDEMRERFPAFYSTFGRGYTVLTAVDLLRDAFQNPTVFSSTSNQVQNPELSYRLVPVTIDPPEHTTWRHLLTPYFAPAYIERLEPTVRKRCVELVEGLAPAGRCDFVQDFAAEFPTTIFMGLMGLPLSDARQFMAWEDAILHRTTESDPDMSKMEQAMRDVIAYFGDLLEKRRTDPRDDLVSASLSWEIDGQPVPKDALLDMCLLMFMAGLDTVTSQLGYSFLHLASHPADRDRIARDPDVIPNAVEEFLRYYAIVTPVRKVVQEIDFHGFTLEPNDMVLLPLCAATRDPSEFANADQVDFDRTANRHIAFGAGPHRCVGSHLARRELRIAFEEWHKHIPNYELAPGTSPEDLPENCSGVMSFHTLPLVWDV